MYFLSAIQRLKRNHSLLPKCINGIRNAEKIWKIYCRNLERMVVGDEGDREGEGVLPRRGDDGVVAVEQLLRREGEDVKGGK